MRSIATIPMSRSMWSASPLSLCRHSRPTRLTTGALIKLTRRHRHRVHKGEVWSFTTPAGQVAESFSDNFDVDHDFLTQPIAGHGWDGFLGKGLARQPTGSLRRTENSTCSQRVVVIRRAGIRWAPCCTRR